MGLVANERPIEAIDMQVCIPVEELHAQGILRGDKLTSIAPIAEKVINEMEEMGGIYDDWNIDRKKWDRKVAEAKEKGEDIGWGVPRMYYLADLEKCRMEYVISNQVQFTKNTREPTALIDVRILCFAL